MVERVGMTPAGKHRDWFAARRRGGQKQAFPCHVPSSWMQRVMVAVSLLLLTMTFVPSSAWAKYAAIVVDVNTGRVLYQNNADVRNYPASLTKMMTLYLLFESLESGKTSMSTRMSVSAHAAGQAPTKMGLKPGSTIRVDEAIKSLVTKSANDVAVVISEYLGGSETSFATKMTRKARQLGMSRTTFRNASGLPNRGQMSTARDMATLSVALQRDFPEYYHFFSLRSFHFRGRTVSTHNRVLLKYRGADGLKTGYIRASGFNLAASAKRDGIRLVGVVFGGRTAAWRDKRMMSLLDKGFATADKVAAMTAPKPHPKPYGVASVVTPVPVSPASAPQDMVIPLTKPASLAGLTTASPAPAVGGVQPVRLSSGLKQSWGVQVGAFGGFDAAQQRAEAAARRLQGRLGDVQVAVTSVKSNGGLIYRSRVLGLDTERQAQNACVHLRAQNISCMLVRPGSVDVAYVSAPGQAVFSAE